MTTAFDTVPVMINNDTVELVQCKHMLMQREGDINFADVTVSNGLRASIIDAQLEHIMEFPSSPVNKEIVIRMAAQLMAWIEAIG